jgi:signal transduction histidine kinase
MTKELVFQGLGLLVIGVVGWIIGIQIGGRKVQGQITALLRAVRSGKVPAAGQSIPGETPALAELRSVLSKSWVPRGSPEDNSSLAAVERIADYLRVRVEEPMLDALDQGDEAVREGAESVLDAVEDLRFFLEDPPPSQELETQNLVDLVGDVTREFSGQFTVRVRVEAPPEPLRVQLNEELLKDALFLILHNAGEYGGGEMVEMTLFKEEDSVRILIRDGGPGFTAEALIRALDPFYSTTAGGMGLGLPHARKAVQAQGGELVLRNSEEGGGEVEIVLPQAN